MAISFTVRPERLSSRAVSGKKAPRVRVGAVVADCSMAVLKLSREIDECDCEALRYFFIVIPVNEFLF